MCRAELEYEAALERRRQELEAERQRAEQEMLRWVGRGIIPCVCLQITFIIPRDAFRVLLLAMLVSPRIHPSLGVCLGRACCCRCPGAGAAVAAGTLPVLTLSNAALRVPAGAGAFALRC